MHWAGGVCIPPCTGRGVCVCVPECTGQEEVSTLGVSARRCLPMGVSAQGVSAQGSVGETPRDQRQTPSRDQWQTPPPWTDSHLWKHNLHKLRLSAVITNFMCQWKPRKKKAYEISVISGVCLWLAQQDVYACQPYVTDAGNFTVWPSVFPVIPAESGIPSLRTGSAQPYLVVNRILIYSGGLGLPHQEGWRSCSGVLSTLLSGTTVFATSTKR